MVTVFPFLAKEHLNCAEPILESYLRTIFNALPDHLSERTRVLNGQPLAKNGAFVLYWMHHAVRGHENPALDTAMWVADRLDLPLLVYQGLGGRHRYNSDRHHTFILEGARDAAAELERRGITYCFHLAEEPEDPGPLRGLITRAALNLTEDFPAPPFKRWTRSLAASAPGSFTQAENGAVSPVSTTFKGSECIGGSHAEIIMGVHPDLTLRR